MCSVSIGRGASRLKTVSQPQCSGICQGDTTNDRVDEICRGVFEGRNRIERLDGAVIHWPDYPSAPRLLGHAPTRRVVAPCVRRKQNPPTLPRTVSQVTCDGKRAFRQHERSLLEDLPSEINPGLRTIRSQGDTWPLPKSPPFILLSRGILITSHTKDQRVTAEGTATGHGDDRGAMNPITRFADTCCLTHGAALFGWKNGESAGDELAAEWRRWSSAGRITCAYYYFFCCWRKRRWSFLGLTSKSWLFREYSTVEREVFGNFGILFDEVCVLVYYFSNMEHCHFRRKFSH
ncbi:uncharacterized protein LOC143177311 [Calliopsis andreniformis]|uniref:uncharacterized protein LOC143177311 n=1 Tax=Calliopsis andreniformis TaxID=337506 RepID=UPI003FCE1703